MDTALHANSRKRIAGFFFGYMSVFLILAICGYYFVGTKMPQVHPVMVNGFATDLAYYDMPRITIAVGGEGDKAHVRIDISLEVSKKDVAVVEGYQPQIADKLNKFFISLPPDEFRRFASIPELREEMLRQVNSVGSPVPVHDLLLRQLVVM